MISLNHSQIEACQKASELFWWAYAYDYDYHDYDDDMMALSNEYHEDALAVLKSAGVDFDTYKAWANA